MTRLAESGDAWTTRAEIAEAVGLPAANSARLVRLLVDFGYVEELRGPSGIANRLTVEGSLRLRAAALQFAADRSPGRT